MPADVVKQAAKVGGCGRQYAKNRVVANRRDDRVAVFLFDERYAHRPMTRTRANFVGRGNDSGHACCQTLCIELDRGLAVDQQAIAAENDDRLDAWPLTDGDSEVANGRHQCSIESGAKLDMASNLVKRIRLNCHELQGIIENRDGTVVPLPLKQVMSTRKFALAIIASALGMLACGDPQGILASLPTSADAYTVYALTGTPASLPSGINTYLRAAVLVDGNANFDVALDLDANNKIVFLPVQKVVSSISSNRVVGIRKVSGAFADVTIAPTGTYPDSTVLAAPGEVVILQSLRNGTNDACSFSISPYIYSKLSVDSVNLATRRIYVKAIVDPNCGFRSFETGIPGK